jgi:hypothetical protein
MKKILVIAALVISGFLFNNEAKTPHTGYGFGLFYSQLSPHGTWIELEAGLVVWRPAFVRRGWAPYSMGRWVWTEYGWYWDSYESFGHIVYHYGRWYYDDYYGWIWIPDYDWAPAWVEWRYDDYYIGWAPLPPYAVFSISIGIHFTYDYYTPYHHWHFVRFNNFCDPYVYNHYVGSKYKYRIYSNTKYRNDYSYSNGRVVNRGVDVDYVRKRSGQNIRQREIVRVNNPEEFGKTRDRNVIRGYMDSREEILKRDQRGDRNVEIKRSDRKSSLISNKVELGERRRINQESTQGNNDVILRDKTNSRDSRERIDNENKNNEGGKIIPRKEERTINRTDTQTGKETRTRQDQNINKKNTQKNENPVIKKRSENQNNSFQNGNPQRTEVKVQRNTERKVEVQRNTERKTDGQKNNERNNSGNRRR